MIHYTLRCDKGHQFDGWFASSAAFDTQNERGLLTCPQCDSAKVQRALMAPAVVAGRDTRGAAPAATGEAQEREDTSAPGAGGPPPAPAAQPGEMALMDERGQKLRALIKAMHAAVKEYGVDVGTNFPEEARRIHYGEAEARGIYGQADLEEARALLEEGIDILPIPALPDEQN
ncbi:DUF1178 family protein [Acuticoccus sediminis]|uniref:DUF1178 family protein n=1 Tax=Acuticoccus sediminis TaxID=2184697 RepID=UPI001CFC722A|nr:DUF1178 family protein [Acuticoccus sediminis]